MKTLYIFFADSMIPLSCIDNQYLRTIFNKLKIDKIGLKIMSRRTMGRLINECYDNQLQDIKEEINKVKFVCTTVDIWSGRKRAF